MSLSLSVKRQYEVIRLSDDADSPEFVLDFSDSNIRKWSTLYKQVSPDIEALQGCTEMTAEVSERIARCFEVFIGGLVGNDAYLKIVQYLGGGRPASDINLGMAAVFSGLAGILSEKANAAKQITSAKYLREAAPADIL